MKHLRKWPFWIGILLLSARTWAAGGFTPGEVWLDAGGAPIQAHSGGILVAEDRFFWYGEDRTPGRAAGVSCYSSTNLYDWKHEGVVLMASEVHAAVIERPKVIFNPHTRKYVMWMHLEQRGGYTYSRAGIATSDSPTGPFRFKEAIRPIEQDFGYEAGKADRQKELGGTYRDMNLFLDDDGKAYAFYASEGNWTMYVVRLNEDFTGPEIPAVLNKTWGRILVRKMREAPAPFKYKDRYYLITSACTGWNPNVADYAVADNILGPYESKGNPCVGTNAEKTFGTQSTFVLPVAGKPGSYVAMFDLWKPRQLSDSRYVWLPLILQPDGTFTLTWRDKWDLSVFTNPSDGPAPVAHAATAGCTVEVSRPGAAVAPICRGQQLEEFNYQFEGGLYAQLINNPSFEELKNPLTGWTLIKPGSSNGDLHGQTSAETSLLNNRQQHCAKLEVTSVASGGVGLANGGYWGIGLRNDTTYRVSFWAKKGPHFSGTIKAALESNDGTVYAHSADFEPTTTWQRFTCDLTTSGISSLTGANRFVIYASTTGEVYFDVVTLMPPTWKNRPNGLRLDLAEKLAALKLKYIQFPGGCTAESAGMDVCWNWKNSIGPLEERPGSTRNRWGYKNDLYFGLDEYLQSCEDLGAEPVYVTSSGISENAEEKEWFGICPLDQMPPIITDIMDLLEYCNGPTSTKWGARRAANGHPEPYHLKYIEIGNENGWQTVKEYIPRYSMIHDAILAQYPEMKIMFNATGVPPAAPEKFLDFADDHFYEKDLSHLYDKYDRINPACKTICVAEYASSIHGNGGDVIGNFGDALGDAVFMLGCERNSERMWWTGYGNYAGLLGHGNFGPCIVWNDAVTNFATPSYYMQKMLFTDNAGTQVLPFTQDTTNCYWSASIDTEAGKNDVLLKVVNKSSTSESVRVTLSGAGDVHPVGHFTVLTGALDAENSLANPNRVVPSAGTFVASVSFNYLFPAYSISLLRLGLSR